MFSTSWFHNSRVDLLRSNVDATSTLTSLLHRSIGFFGDDSLPISVDGLNWNIFLLVHLGGELAPVEGTAHGV